jgi:MFS family permease
VDQPQPITEDDPAGPASPSRPPHIREPREGMVDGPIDPVSQPSPRMAAAGGINPAAAHRSRLGVLRHHHFRNVWLGAFISNIGGWMEGVGVQWIVARTTGSPVMLANLAVAQLAPTLVLGMVGGIVADRVNRKQLLLVTQAIMMVIAAMLAAASYMGWATPAVLLSLALAQGITLAFNTPAWQVLTPRLVPRQELTEAIALNGLQFNLARVIGPALAGLLMAWFNPTVLFVVNTASFLAVLTAIWSTPDAPAPVRRPTGLWRPTAESLSFVFHRRGPRAVFVGMVTFAILAAPLMRMLPLFAKDVYPDHDPLIALARGLLGEGSVREVIFGYLLAVMGAGAVAGAIALRRFPLWYPKHHFIPLSILLSGVAIAGFGATHSLAAASVLLFFGGACWLWAFNSSFAAMQMLVPDEMRGRVMSIVNMAVFGAMPLGAYMAGVIGHIAGAGLGAAAETQIGVGAMGAALAGAGLIMLIWRTPEVDGLAPGDAGYTRTPGLLRGITASAHRPLR